MMKDELKNDEMVRRTYRYFYDDGLAETVTGLLFILVALVLFGWGSLGEAPWVTPVVLASSGLLLVASPILMTRAIRAVKARVTFPRTGYVAYRSRELANPFPRVDTSGNNFGAAGEVEPNVRHGRAAAGTDTRLNGNPSRIVAFTPGGGCCRSGWDIGGGVWHG